MHDEQPNALSRLSAWTFREFRAYRKFIKSGPYIVSITSVQVDCIRINVEGEADSLEEAIHKAVNEIERVNKGFLSPKEPSESPPSPSE